MSNGRIDTATNEETSLVDKVDKKNDRTKLPADWTPRMDEFFSTDN